MRLLLYIFFLIPLASPAQSSDFIILKKKDKTIRNIFAGSNIAFVTTNGVYRDAYINAINNDSIYLQEFVVNRAMTTFGTYILDTAGSFRYVYHYNQIGSFGPPKQKGFNMSGSGAALMGGGTLLTLASGVSYLADKEKFSPGLLAAAVGLGGLGYLMNKSASKGMVIGNKYRLQYMKMK
ncbi:MAG: hypothetical protein EOO06_09095 [Chitinophagaceae bacterium]|nr:MAG: hypothetical protein EOO06_09095 [Chitinophagaceae bacterium]